MAEAGGLFHQALDHFPTFEPNQSLEHLPKAGFDEIAPPDGAFYVYADVSRYTDDSVGMAQDILEKVGVAVTPGLDFDKARGGTKLRFSYARSTSDIEEGLSRLAAYMRSEGHID